MSRMLTSGDVCEELQYADRRTARKLMKALGADAYGRPYRLPRETFEAWLRDPDRITGGPTQDPGSSNSLHACAGSGRDPGVPSPSGWWRQEPLR